MYNNSQKAVVSTQTDRSANGKLMQIAMQNG